LQYIALRTIYGKGSHMIFDLKITFVLEHNNDPPFIRGDYHICISNIRNNNGVIMDNGHVHAYYEHGIQLFKDENCTISDTLFNKLKNYLEEDPFKYDSIFEKAIEKFNNQFQLFYEENNIN